MINTLTIDVEDYWSIFFRDWLNIPEAKPTEAVVRNTEWFLQILAEYDVKATFFILGEVAEKFPDLVRKISKEEHEIGVHGFCHKQIFKLTRDDFKKEVGDAKKLLENIVGQEVIGHRAPAFSINEDTKWAFEVLAELGYEYDSSVYPIAGKRYGWPGFSKSICKLNLSNNLSMVEVPMSTVNIFGKTLPVAGGGYIRHFPYTFTKLAIKHIQKLRPAIVYIHPYEVDTENREFPTTHLSVSDRKKVFKFHKVQLRNRNTMREKVCNLMSDFRFSTLKELIKNSDIKTGYDG